MQIGDRTSAFGSGGMRSKVAAAEMASEAGHPGGDLQRDHAGDAAPRRRPGEPVGTRFAAQAGKASSFKLWLKYAKPTRGQSLVDDGAARVLRERGSSLLPVGIVEVDGSFEAGDAVDVLGAGGPIGKGISDYSARELEQVMGMKSDAVRERPSSRGRRGHPPRPLRPGLAPLGGPSYPCSDGRDHDHRRRVLRRRQAGGAVAGERLAPRPRTPPWRRPRGCSKSAAPRSSRPTPPTSPTSAPPA